jgi:hypothetical protein
MLLTVTLLAAVTIAAVAFAAGPAIIDATPAQTIAKQKKTIATLRSQRDDLQDEVDAQNDLIATQTDTITRLRARDPLDAILARDPDGLWDAANAIWRVFPSFSGSLCGYDKSSTQPDGLTPSSLSFFKFDVC